MVFIFLFLYSSDVLKAVFDNYGKHVKDSDIVKVMNRAHRLGYCGIIQVAQRELQERAVRKEDYNPKASEEMGL